MQPPALESDVSEKKVLQKLVVRRLFRPLFIDTRGGSEKSNERR
jgi:hypothetical protein